MSLDQLCCQQLKIFLAVYRHRNGTRAAVELGLTNSAVSRGLSALRTMFADDLFVRTVNGFVPTEKAVEIAPCIEQIVNDLRQLGRHSAVFDPAKSESTFEILVYDEFNYPVQSVIDRLIRPQAPRMHFNVHTLSYDCLNELVNGTVDFAIVYEGFDDSRLNYECFACTSDIYLLCRRNHPLFANGIDFTAADLSKYPLLEIDNYRDLSCPLLVDVCNESGSSMQVSDYTESVASAFRIIADSDSVAVVCNQFTRQFADMIPNLDYVRLPQKIMARIKQMRSAVRPIGNYVVFGNTNRSPAFRWVRDELVLGLKKSWVEALSSAREKKYPIEEIP